MPAVIAFVGDVEIDEGTAFLTFLYSGECHSGNVHTHVHVTEGGHPWMGGAAQRTGSS